MSLLDGLRVVEVALLAIFATRTQAEWVQLFLDADVPGGPVHDTRSLLRDPQFVARTDLVEHHHPVAGALRMLGTPIRHDAAPAPAGPAPECGEHTDEVLREVLGYDRRRIEALRSRQVIA